MSKLWTSWAIASLTSVKANLIPVQKINYVVDNYLVELYICNCDSLPMQFLGPWPNGRKVYVLIFPLFSAENRSGSNFSGSG